MKNSFEPKNLQLASKHLDWIIENAKVIYKAKNKSLWQKILAFLTRVF